MVWAHLTCIATIFPLLARDKTTAQAKDGTQKSRHTQNITYIVHTRAKVACTQSDITHRNVGISRVKNANEMQNKRELNGSNESRCTEMSSNNRIKLRRRQIAMGKKSAQDERRRLAAATAGQPTRKKSDNHFHGMLAFSSIHTRHTYNVIAGASFLSRTFHFIHEMLLSLSLQDFVRALFFSLVPLLIHINDMKRNE